MRCPVCDEVFEDKLASCPLCATPSPGVASLPAGRASLDSRIEALAGRADSVIQQATSRLAGNGDEASTGTRADFTRPVELRGQAVEALAQAGPAPPAKGLTPTAPLAFLVPLGEGLDVEVEGPRRSDSGRLQLHYASIHYGEPLLRRLVIRNQDFLPVNNVVLSIEIPRYAAPWRRTLGRLERDKPVVLRDIRLEIDVERIRQLVEADISAQLDLSVEADGKLLYSESLPVEVLAYSEWRYDLSQHPDALACFVQPNAPALRSLLSDTASCLEVLTGSDALSGYQ